MPLPSFVILSSILRRWKAEIFDVSVFSCLPRPCGRGRKKKGPPTLTQLGAPWLAPEATWASEANGGATCCVQITTFLEWASLMFLSPCRQLPYTAAPSLCVDGAAKTKRGSHVDPVGSPLACPRSPGPLGQKTKQSTWQLLVSPSCSGSQARARRRRQLPYTAAPSLCVDGAAKAGGLPSWGPPGHPQRHKSNHEDPGDAMLHVTIRFVAGAQHGEVGWNRGAP